ncbi:MAG: hypothetical protein WCS73_06050 [Lentisphaeria bacterium]
MIFPAEVPPENKAKSQRYYNYFSIMNGVSYMCVGETVIILLAIKIGCPDYLISLLGAMMYIGFLLMFLGKPTCARYGAAKTQGVFWMARNVAALLVAFSGVLGLLGFSGAAFACILSGAFFFYGFRASGVVMCAPLVASFTDRDDLGKVLGVSAGYFYLFSLLTLLAIQVVLLFSESIWSLIGIIVVGSIAGFVSSKFILELDESAALLHSSQKPLMQEWHGFWHNIQLRRFLPVNFLVGFMIIVVNPVSMLVVKKGYSLRDMAVLGYAMLLLLSSALCSYVGSKVVTKIGPRKLYFPAYFMFLSVPVIWYFVPVRYSTPASCLVFFMIGGGAALMNLGGNQYFIQLIPEKKQIAYSVFMMLITVPISGIVGGGVSSLLLKRLVSDGMTATQLLQQYKIYFAIVFVLLCPGFFFIKRLIPLPEEVLKRSKHWWGRSLLWK